MRTHLEIRIRLKLQHGKSLHDVLRGFAQKTKGWQWLREQSEDYQSSHGASAGYVFSNSVGGLPRAVVAVANVNPKNPNMFRVTNIVPSDCSSLTMDQYNAIGQTFAESFRKFLNATRRAGIVEMEGPEIWLPQIIHAPKCRHFFEAYLRTHAPLCHPSDIRVLDIFICAVFRYAADISLDDIETYLIKDHSWQSKDAAWVRKRIETGLDILRINRRF